MSKWHKYAYCKQCDRPLREGEYIKGGECIKSFHVHVVGTALPGGYPRYKCVICGGKGFAYSMHDRALTILFVLVPLCLIWACGQMDSEELTVGTNRILMGFLPLLVLSLGLNHWKKYKLKPIYDRWVKVHGSNPGEWPYAMLKPRPGPGWQFWGP